jgi:hypothetical protein
METNIYIRAKVDGKWQSVDVADPRLPADMLLRWLATLTNEGVIEVIDAVRRNI